MSASSNTPSQMPLPRSALHERVERLGLALGAEQERRLRARLILAPGETNPNKAIDGWKNEDGHLSDVTTSRISTAPRSTKIFWFSADLFRDNTLTRAVIMNALLTLMAATILIIMYD